MVGGPSSVRSPEAWRQVYRALSHGEAKSACKQPTMSKFPKQIQDFANIFISMQAKRHDADYDPDIKYFKSTVIYDIATAEAAINDFSSANVKDRRAFAAWVLFKVRS